MSDPDQTLGIVGLFTGNHLGGSLARGGTELGWTVVTFDADRAEARSRLSRSLLRRLGMRRPLRLDAFGRGVVQAATVQGIGFILATGRAPLAAAELCRLRAAGIVTGLFSSDDPWSAGQRAGWYLAALPGYDVVFTPRAHTVPEFQSIGCARVETVPFGYDEFFIAPAANPPAGTAILFVGGADEDRVAFMTDFAAREPIGVVGAYWSRHRIPQVTDLGHRSPQDVAALTAAARVNLCLVRRANRDGHVMRTYEMAATGAAMVVEDTPDHRALFGPEGDAVLYFGTPPEAAMKARALLSDEKLRLRLRTNAQRRIVLGRHTYRDRLQTMLASLADAKARRTGGAA